MQKSGKFDVLQCQWQHMRRHFLLPTHFTRFEQGWYLLTITLTFLFVLDIWQIWRNHDSLRCDRGRYIKRFRFFFSSFCIDKPDASCSFTTANCGVCGGLILHFYGNITSTYKSTNNVSNSWYELGCDWYRSELEHRVLQCRNRVTLFSRRKEIANHWLRDVVYLGTLRDIAQRP